MKAAFVCIFCHMYASKVFFGDIVVKAYAAKVRICVPLPYAAPIALCHISGPPRNIHMMHGRYAILNINARTHLSSRTD